jgi:hypothetical protein
MADWCHWRFPLVPDKAVVLKFAPHLCAVDMDVPPAWHDDVTVSAVSSSCVLTFSLRPNLTGDVERKDLFRYLREEDPDADQWMITVHRAPGAVLMVAYSRDAFR